MPFGRRGKGGFRAHAIVRPERGVSRGGQLWSSVWESTSSSWTGSPPPRPAGRARLVQKLMDPPEASRLPLREPDRSRAIALSIAAKECHQQGAGDRLDPRRAVARRRGVPRAAAARAPAGRRRRPRAHALGSHGETRTRVELRGGLALGEVWLLVSEPAREPAAGELPTRPGSTCGSRSPACSWCSRASPSCCRSCRSTSGSWASRTRSGPRCGPAS